MSAMRWSPCPQCIAHAREEWLGAERAANHAYGTVPFSEFQQLQRLAGSKLEVMEGVSERHNLREDWNLHLNAEGKFSFHYYCHCQECDLTHRLEYSTEIPIAPKVKHDA